MELSMDNMDIIAGGTLAVMLALFHADSSLCAIDWHSHTG